MTLLIILILGIVQGITEFVPVSSSGHLILGQHFFGMDELGLSFDVALHLGTLLALIIYFKHDIVMLAKAIIKKREETNLACLLIAATVPAAIFGLMLEDIAATAFRSPLLVAINLSLIGLLMLGAERYYHIKVRKPTQLNGVSKKQAMAMGFAQALALIPGVSRSGITITSGLLVGMDRVAATRFSFLLGIPIMIGAIARTLTRPEAMDQIANEQTAFLIGISAAFLSGLVAIRFLLSFLGHHSLATFAYYRFALSAVVLAVLFLL